jgi:phosphoribosylaminoimidazole-succinocarboxamide synthase
MEKIAQPFYNFQNQTNFYRGKVRDVYSIGDDKLVMIASNRISAFDVILPKEIPYKGQVLNQIAFHHLNQTKDIIPNWVLSSPLPYVTVGYKCVPYKVELVVRGYLAGHAAREYALGKRTICGVLLPDGLVENQKLPSPILTPTTKADVGHDEDISREQIFEKGIVSESEYIEIEKAALALYQRGTELAAKQGLLLVDTKYEFGKLNNKLTLMDEIHTPDSSRYFLMDGYEEYMQQGKSPKQLSKEFVRQWLIENNFQGKEGQQVPEMTNVWVDEISNRYIELYKKITGLPFNISETPSKKEMELLINQLVF